MNAVAEMLDPKAPRTIKQGVYVLSSEASPVYVGSTRCLRERIGDHKRRGLNFDSIDFLAIDDRKTSLSVERQLISTLRPKYNVNGNKDPFAVKDPSVCVRLPRKLYEQLERIAAQDDRTLSSLIRKALVKAARKAP